MKIISYRLTILSATKSRLKRWTFLCLLAVGSSGIIIGGMGQYYSLSFNLTRSLDGTAYWVKKRTYPHHVGELIAFRVPDNPFYPNNMMFIKMVGGVPGDTVSRQQNSYFVNGKRIGIWHSKATSGQLMYPGPVGVIPPDHYFVYTQHPRSFDSRYGRIGWIRKSKVVGVATELF